MRTNRETTSIRGKWSLAGAALLLGLLPTASAQTAEYAGWQHSGSIHILTTPEGANGLSTNRIPVNPGDPQRFYLLTIPYN